MSDPSSVPSIPRSPVARPRERLGGHHMRGRRSVSVLAALSMMVLLLVQASPAGAVGTRWESRLTTSVQPQNFQRYCDDDGAPHPNCSWMFRHVYDRSGGHKAPKNGYVSKVRIIACSAGSFYLQFGRVRPDPERAGPVPGQGPQDQRQGLVLRRPGWMRQRHLHHQHDQHPGRLRLQERVLRGAGEDTACASLQLGQPQRPRVRSAPRQWRLVPRSRPHQWL